MDVFFWTHCILFYLLIIQLIVYKRSVARFTANDKVVYQGVRPATRLASDNSWVWSTRPENYPVHTWKSNVSFMQYLTFFGLSFWLSTKSSTFSMLSSLRAERVLLLLLLHGCCTIVRQPGTSRPRSARTSGHAFFGTQCTRSPAVAERSRDASCLSVSSFNSTIYASAIFYY